MSAAARAVRPALLPSSQYPAPPLSYDRVLPGVPVTAEQLRSFSSRNVQVGAFRDQDPLDVPLINNVITREVA